MCLSTDPWNLSFSVSVQVSLSVSFPGSSFCLRGFSFGLAFLTLAALLLSSSDWPSTSLFLFFDLPHNFVRLVFVFWVELEFVSSFCACPSLISGFCNEVGCPSQNDDKSNTACCPFSFLLPKDFCWDFFSWALFFEMFVHVGTFPLSFADCRPVSGK